MCRSYVSVTLSGSATVTSMPSCDSRPESSSGNAISVGSTAPLPQVLIESTSSTWVSPKYSSTVPTTRTASPSATSAFGA